MTINELREKRKQAWNAAKAFVETKRDKDGLLSEEDAATYAQMEKKVQDYGAEIERMEAMSAMEAQLNRPTSSPITEKPMNGKPATEEKPKTGRASDAYRTGMLTALRSNFHQVSDVLREGVDADGGYLVPEEYDSRLIQTLSEENIMRKLGHTITTSGEHTISVRAKKTSTMSGYFYVTYNGNKTKYLFNKSTTFDWTDYSVTLTDVTDPTLRIYCYCRDASIYLADIMISEGAIPRKWTPAPNEIYTQEVKIDKRGIEVSNSASSQRTVITNTEFAGYYNDEVIFTLNKDETQTKKTTVDGELTVGKTKFVPMPTASEGLNIVILD